MHWAAQGHGHAGGPHGTPRGHSGCTPTFVRHVPLPWAGMCVFFNTQLLQNTDEWLVNYKYSPDHLSPYKPSSLSPPPPTSPASAAPLLLVLHVGAESGASNMGMSQGQGVPTWGHGAVGRAMLPSVKSKGLQ